MSASFFLALLNFAVDCSSQVLDYLAYCLFKATKKTPCYMRMSSGVVDYFLDCSIHSSSFSFSVLKPCAESPEE